MNPQNKKATKRATKYHEIVNEKCRKIENELKRKKTVILHKSIFQSVKI